MEVPFTYYTTSLLSLEFFQLFLSDRVGDLAYPLQKINICTMSILGKSRWMEAIKQQQQCKTRVQGVHITWQLVVLRGIVRTEQACALD